MPQSRSKKARKVKRLKSKHCPIVTETSSTENDLPTLAAGEGGGRGRKRKKRGGFHMKRFSLSNTKLGYCCSEKGERGKEKLSKVHKDRREAQWLLFFVKLALRLSNHNPLSVSLDTICTRPFFFFLLRSTYNCMGR